MSAAVTDTGSTCHRYAGTEGYFANVTDSEICYVVFPQRNTRAEQIWYEARNMCLLEGGDLADESAASLPLGHDVKYLIGLRRDVIVWIESGKLVCVCVCMCVLCRPICVCTFRDNR